MRLVLCLAAFALAAAPSALQDDVLQLKEKDGIEGPKILIGKVVKLTEKYVEFQDKRVGLRTIPVDDIEPYSLYRIKSARINDKSAKAHYDLGSWCLSAGLYATAIRELNEAKDLDKSLKKSCDEKIRTAHEEDARTKLEKAKTLILEKRYKDASGLLADLMNNYDDTPYSEKAKEEMEKLTKALEEENRRKEEELKKKKRAMADKKDKEKMDRDKRAINEAVTLLEQAKKSWGEGLKWEEKDNITQARKAWDLAERTLDRAKVQVAAMLKSENVDVIKEATDLDKELDAWRVKNYWRLARNHAEHLSYAEAIKYINRAIATPHDAFMDQLLNELLLTVTQMRMRKRAAGGGY